MKKNILLVQSIVTLAAFSTTQLLSMDEPSKALVEKKEKPTLTNSSDSLSRRSPIHKARKDTASLIRTTYEFAVTNKQFSTVANKKEEVIRQFKAEQAPAIKRTVSKSLIVPPTESSFSSLEQSRIEMPTEEGFTFSQKAFRLWTKNSDREEVKVLLQSGFNTTNKDHIALFKSALCECVQHNDQKSFEEIIDLTKRESLQITVGKETVSYQEAQTIKISSELASELVKLTVKKSKEQQKSSTETLNTHSQESINKFSILTKTLQQNIEQLLNQYKKDTQDVSQQFVNVTEAEQSKINQVISLALLSSQFLRKNDRLKIECVDALDLSEVVPNPITSPVISTHEVADLMLSTASELSDLLALIMPQADEKPAANLTAEQNTDK